MEHNSSNDGSACWNQPHSHKDNNKTPVFISMDREKAFNKIQHPFMIKKKKKDKTLRIVGNFSIIKAIYERCAANIIKACLEDIACLAPDHSNKANYWDKENLFFF